MRRKRRERAIAAAVVAGGREIERTSVCGGGVYTGVCVSARACVCRTETERETRERERKKRFTSSYLPCNFLSTPPSIVSASALSGPVRARCKYTSDLFYSDVFSEIALVYYCRDGTSLWVVHLCVSLSVWICVQLSALRRPPCTPPSMPVSFLLCAVILSGHLVCVHLHTYSCVCVETNDMAVCQKLVFVTLHLKGSL